MKASVFTRQGEPTTVEPTKAFAGVKVEDLNVVSEYSLKLAVWALQNVQANSRCHASRMTARTTLQFLGETGDVDVDDKGLPKSVKFPGNPVDQPNVWVR